MHVKHPYFIDKAFKWDFCNRYIFCKDLLTINATFLEVSSITQARIVGRIFLDFTLHTLYRTPMWLPSQIVDEATVFELFGEVGYPPVSLLLAGSFSHSDSALVMTSSNGNILRVTGLLCGEFTGHRWIPHTNASYAGLWCFLWSAPEPTLEETMETPLIWDAVALIMTSLLCTRHHQAKAVNNPQNIRECISCIKWNTFLIN